MRPHIIIRVDKEGKIKKTESTAPIHMLVIGEGDITNKNKQTLEIKEGNKKIKVNAYLEDYEKKWEIIDNFNDWNKQSKNKDKKLLHGEFNDMQARYTANSNEFLVICKSCSSENCFIGTTSMFDHENYMMTVTGVFCEDCGTFQNILYYPVEYYEEDAHHYDEYAKSYAWPDKGQVIPDEMSEENYGRYKNELEKYMEQHKKLRKQK